MKQIKDMNVTEIKVYIYDASKTIQGLQNDINALENELKVRAEDESKKDSVKENILKEVQ